jgi:E3 ubiquitin-protein ligase DOA10
MGAILMTKLIKIPRRYSMVRQRLSRRQMKVLAAVAATAMAANVAAADFELQDNAVSVSLSSGSLLDQESSPHQAEDNQRPS